jgi:glycosyltransferase involved in cell wall biosynthesis
MQPELVCRQVISSGSASISLIVTAFEQRVSLPLLLLALARQRLPVPFEVIVCDDGSSPQLAERAFAIASKKRLDLRYVWQQRTGPRAARSKNNGIRCAQGELLIFLDADILVQPDFLLRHWQMHQSGGSQIVCNPRKWFFPGGAPAFHKRPTQSCVLDGLRHLSDLMLRDMDSAFEYLEAHSEEVDRQWQRDHFSSDAPWKACVGFSFSVRNSSFVRFDEAFEGWGPEDRELALRLVTQHGCAVQYIDDIDVYHIEACSTGRTPYSNVPILPDQIEAYLRNMLYFIDKYPGQNLLSLCKPFLLYAVDEQERKWRPVSHAAEMTGPGVDNLVERKIRDVRQWFRNAREKDAWPARDSGSQHSQLPYAT